MSGRKGKSSSASKGSNPTRASVKPSKYKKAAELKYKLKQYEKQTKNQALGANFSSSKGKAARPDSSEDDEPRPKGPNRIEIFRDMEDEEDISQMKWEEGKLKSGRSCYNCDSPDHIKKDCPQPLNPNKGRKAAPQPQAINVINNFHPPVPVPGNPRVPPPEYGHYDTPDDIHVTQFVSRQSYTAQTAIYVWLLYRLSGFLMIVRRMADKSWWSWLLNYRSFTVGRMTYDIVNMIPRWTLYYFLANGAITNFIFPRIKMTLHKTGRRLNPMERHLQNRSVPPTPGVIDIYEYTPVYHLTSWFQRKWAATRDYIYQVAMPAFTNIVPRMIAGISPRIGGMAYIAMQMLSAQLPQTIAAPSDYELMSDADCFYNADGTRKTETVSQELFHSAMSTRTTNGHMLTERLETNIEQHILNRTDTSLTLEDFQNTSSVATSTTTVVKYIALENAHKTISLGFCPGPRSQNTNTATGFSNSTYAGGQNNQNARNRISEQNYRPNSERGYLLGALHSAHWVYNGMVYAALILILGILWGQLLAKSNDLQHLFHSMLQGSRQWMDYLFIAGGSQTPT